MLGFENFELGFDFRSVYGSKFHVIMPPSRVSEL